MKLVGIIGDRGIFSFTDPMLRAENQWPKAITLAPGEQFESVSIVSVSPDAVTLEEDGTRQIKELTRVR
jgi:hypothetical protein